MDLVDTQCCVLGAPLTAYVDDNSVIVNFSPLNNEKTKTENKKSPHGHELEVMLTMIITIRESPPSLRPVISSLQTGVECPLERPPPSPHSSAASRYPIIVHLNKLPLYSSTLVTKTPPLYLLISSHFVPDLSSDGRRHTGLP